MEGVVKVFGNSVITELMMRPSHYSTLALQTIVKCNWSDNFDAYIVGEICDVLYVLCMTSHPFIMIFIFYFLF